MNKLIEASKIHMYRTYVMELTNTAHIVVIYICRHWEFIFFLTFGNSYFASVAKTCY